MEPQFYLPAKYLPSEDRRQAWESGVPRLEAAGKAATAQAWIYQTFVRLKGAGVPARLVHEMPATGLAVALAGNLPPGFRYPEHVFLAAVVADGLPAPQAQIQIVQNPLQRVWGAQTVFLPHWPQPSLVPRDPARGGRFETIAFFGDAENLAPELSDFGEVLRRELGLRWEIRPAERWHDYSDVDCAIAVRSFDRREHRTKPATKLYNAWLAGVPFIGGNDSAYAFEGSAGRDYLAAGSVAELLAHLRSLQGSPEFREQLVIKGAASGQKRNAAAVTRLWREMVEKDLPSRTQWWRGLSLRQRRGKILRQSLGIALQNRLGRFIG